MWSVRYVGPVGAGDDNTYLVPTTFRAFGVMMGDMDPDVGALLPDAYARALGLVAAGCSDESLARALEIDVAALPALLAIARAKAANAALVSSVAESRGGEQRDPHDDA